MEKISILIAEDDLMTAEIIKNSLMQRGPCEVTITNSGERAVALAREIRPHIVLMDISLKENMDGITAAADINKFLDIPIVYITGDSDKKTASRALGTEPYGYILKPFDVIEICTAVDIALYKHRMGAKLKESEEHFRRLAENYPDIICRFDRSLRYVYINPGVERYLGRKPSEFIGKSQSELGFKVVWSERWGNFVTSVFETGIGGEGDFEYEASGKIFFINWRFIPEFDTHGTVRHVLGIMRDITEQKMAGIEREKAYNELDLIFNSASSGMSLIDNDFNYIKVNKSFLKLFNLRESRIMGKKCHEVMGLQYCSTSQCIVKKIIEGEERAGYDIQKEVKGSDLICRAAGTSYKSHDGDIMGAIIEHTDITEQKILERENLRLLEDERQRIGYDLHDGLGQNLTGISFLIEALKIKINTGLSIDKGDILDIESNLKDAIDKTHNLAKGLCPVQMEKDGLMSALSDLAQNTGKMFGLSCRIECQGNFFIEDSQAAMHLYFIARESLNNAVKHGMAKNIIIRLTGSRNRKMMAVMDDGIGIPDVDAIKKNRLGMRIMEYRARLMGGFIEFQNNPGGGFTVLVGLKQA